VTCAGELLQTQLAEQAQRMTPGEVVDL
jgi:hypothetical protein